VNPYPERIDELHEFLATRYGQRDRQATEILLACIMDPAITGSHNLTVKTMVRSMAVCGFEVRFEPVALESKRKG
jgi:hypothetical protein